MKRIRLSLVVLLVTFHVLHGSAQEDVGGESAPLYVVLERQNLAQVVTDAARPLFYDHQFEVLSIEGEDQKFWFEYPLSGCQVLNPCALYDFAVTPEAMLFAASDGTAINLYQISPDGADTRLIDTDLWLLAGVAPAPSPAQAVAYVKNTDPSVGGTVITISDLTGEPTFLSTSEVTRQFRPQWDPQGEWILFFGSVRESLSIYRASPTDGKTERIAQGAVPVWSPDGDQIAYCSGPRTQGLVSLMDRDGQNPRPLTDIPLFCELLLWSPDGAFLLVSDGRSLYRVEVSTGAMQTLFDGGDDGFVQDVEWSPTGDRIALVFDGQLSLMNADGSGVTPQAFDAPVTQIGWP